MNFRMLPPSGQNAVATIGAVQVPVAVNGFADVPEPNARQLAGWTCAGIVGPTSARPVATTAGVFYVDTTLSKVVVSDSSGVWRDPLTGAVA
jgi:hypothetical protein